MIDDKNCWLCGKLFAGDKTLHHAIPKKYKPLKNITIPICFACHTRMHLEDTTRANSIKTKIIGLDKYVKEIKLMLGIEVAQAQ